LGKSRNPVSLAKKYGDGFAHLDDINQYFAGIATDPNYDLDECHLRRVAEDNSEHSGVITCECEVHSMLSSVKKISPGVDDIPYGVFKHCAVELTPVVTYLINTIVSNGTPPPTWLKALVTPVPKKTPPTDFCHLRPISVTPILSRLTERLIVRKHCCLPYPLTNLPISSHTGPVDLLPLPQLPLRIIFLVSLSHARMLDAFSSITLKPFTLSTISLFILPMSGLVYPFADSSKF